MGTDLTRFNKIVIQRFSFRQQTDKEALGLSSVRSYFNLHVHGPFDRDFYVELRI